MFQRIAIVVNKSKEGALSFANNFAKGISPSVEEVTVFSEYPIANGDTFFSHDLCISIGGDGTLLGISSILAKSNTPVLPINHGSLGFLATVGTKYAFQGFKEIQNGKFLTSERMILSVEVNGEIASALNEVVIRSKIYSRLAKLDVFLGEDFIKNYKADGIIVASPTGSTAYNLSAGGPILYPTIDALVLTPICPHMTNAQPIVFPGEKKFIIRSNDEFAVYCDSNFIENTQSAIIASMEKKIKLITLENYSFTNTLREKLKA